MKKNKQKKYFRSFYSRLCDLKKLEDAWNSVYENGMQSPSSQARKQIKDYKFHERKNLLALQEKLQNKTFSPKARATPLEKKEKGKYRPVVSYDINTRIVQRTMLNILHSHKKIEPILNCSTSFGGLKEKSVSDAVKKICTLFKKEGFTHYIASDIKSFFTSIKIDDVINWIGTFCKDADFLDLLNKTMKIEVSDLEKINKLCSEVLEYYNYSNEGVPQGSCLSPLFGNIYLHSLDLELNKNPDIIFLRYIDDVIIIGKSYKDVINSYNNKLVPGLTNLGLSVYGKEDEKFKQGTFMATKGVDYLGVNISSNTVKPTKKATKKLKNELQILLDEALNFEAKKPKSLYEILDIISRKIKGWCNHYWFCNASREFKMLDANIDEMIVKFLSAYNKKLSLLSANELRQQLGVYLASSQILGKTPIMHELKSKK